MAIWEKKLIQGTDRLDSFTMSYLILLWVPFQIQVDVDEGAELYTMKPVLLKSYVISRDASSVAVVYLAW